MRDLFLFAHQDDEYGAFALIEASVAAGRRPLCVYLTNGDFGGQDPAVRNRESRGVLQRLGVAATDCVFLGGDESISDGTLPRHLARAHAALSQCLAARGPVGTLLVVAYEGGHQDHDAACAIAVALLRQGVVHSLRQFPLYHGEGLPGPLFRVLAPLAANGPVTTQRYGLGRRLAYLRHCLRYGSQWKTWLGLLPFVALHYLLRGVQASQALDPLRLASPPHEGAPLYDRRGFFRYAEFHELSRRFLGDLDAG